MLKWLDDECPRCGGKLVNGFCMACGFPLPFFGGVKMRRMKAKRISLR